MAPLFSNPFALVCLGTLAVIIVALIAVPRLFDLFTTNSLSGRVTSANRDWVNGVVVLSVESLSGSGTRTFQAPDPLGEEIERLLLTYRRNRQPVIMTIVYDPRDGVTITSYSLIMQP